MPSHTARKLAQRFVSQFKSTVVMAIVAAIFTAALALAAPTMQAQTQVDAPNAADSTTRAASAGQIKGQLTDPQGLGIIGVTVTLRSTLSGATRTAKTGANGTFTFDSVEPGTYALSAEANGLTLAPRTLDIKSGEEFSAGELRMSLVAAQQQVIVSASRVEEIQDEAPTKVLSITRQQIQDTGYERVGDVLSEVPGVVTMGQSYGVSLVGGEQIDGMDSKETAVLLDGLPFVGARGIDEGYIDLNQQDVGKLDRVEVVKGAASSLYGMDSLGGVVNLISHTPTHPLEIDATTSGGSLGEINTRLGIGGQYGKWSGFLDLEHHQRDSYSLIPDDPTTVGAYENRQDAMGKVSYQFNPRASLTFTATGYANHDHGFGYTVAPDPNDPNNFLNDPTALRSNDSTQTYALVGDFSLTHTTTLQVRGYESKYNEDSSSRLYNDDGTEGDDFDPGNLREIYRRGDATIGQQWGSKQFIQAGYEYAWDQYSGDNRLVGGSQGQEQRTNDLWVQDRIQPWSRVLITLGARYQNNSAYGNHAVPKAGIVYRVNDHLVLRSAFGLGFRAPNLGELYYHLLHLEYGYQVIGNPTLQPERSQTYSGGGTYTQGRYQLSLNLFRNNLRDLIDNVLVCDATSGQDCSGQSLINVMNGYGIPPSFGYDTTGAALFTFINLNVDRAYTQGFDVDGRVAVTPQLSVSGAYTYLEAVDSVSHAWLPYRNRHQGHVKVEYVLPRYGLTANLRGTFFSKWPTESQDGGATSDYAYGYQIWNFYLSKTLGRGVRAFGAINNLADSRDRKLEQNPASFDRPDYGRTYLVGMNYTFPARER